MRELEFTSSLSDEEIKKNFKDIDFFSGIIIGLEESLAYEKGTAKAEIRTDFMGIHHSE